MKGSRIASGDRSQFSTYIGVIVAVLAITGAVLGIYFGLTLKKSVTGFDPNRPVPTDAELRKRLKPEQYHITRESGTDTAFQNEYWNYTRVGIYVDVITGEPLFSSLDKFDGGTGRPTFTQPISKDAVAEKMDTSHDMQRTEVVARRSNAHLGHLFPDPTSPTGQRYAVNSGAFRFIVHDRMQEQGYGAYLSLFDAKK
ncbi:MAG: peptide-methionine (R)-S-oxide reductase MsrB [Spartobacteria bacterium]